ncbi:MAG: DNA-binding response regulator [Acidobacteria bacterium]|nr:MAG: DNA-binding response regulator [Acidobacteriota bacterium]
MAFKPASRLWAGRSSLVPSPAKGRHCASPSPLENEGHVKILLADDHEIVREGLKALLEKQGFTVVAEAADGPDAIRLAKETHPEVAILDLAMPLINGINAAREILREQPKVKVILLTMHTDEHYVLDALQAGVTGYVVKTEAGSDLIHALQEVSRGATYLSSKVSRAIVQAYLEKRNILPDQLTPRERQVLQLIAEGKTTKEIATVLGISAKTADSHRTKIMSKLDTHGVAGLVRYAIRRGLIQP